MIRARRRPVGLKLLKDGDARKYFDFNKPNCFVRSCNRPVVGTSWAFEQGGEVESLLGYSDEERAAHGCNDHKLCDHHMRVLSGDFPREFQAQYDEQRLREMRYMQGDGDLLAFLKWLRKWEPAYTGRQPSNKCFI